MSLSFRIVARIDGADINVMPAELRSIIQNIVDHVISICRQRIGTVSSWQKRPDCFGRIARVIVMRSFFDIIIFVIKII